MNKKLAIYLRTHRLRSGLSQNDVAFLLGKAESSLISKLEQGSRKPNKTTTALGFELIFDAQFGDVFPQDHRLAAEAIGTRAYDLYLKLQGSPSKTTKAKLDFLESLIERARLTSSKSNGEL